MELLEIRRSYNLTQAEVASFLGVPVRTYQRYENDETYGSKFKRDMFVRLINDKFEITETNGLLSVEIITKAVKELFDSEYKNEINFCILFGSYARGNAKEDSDVDLFISSTLKGLRFVGAIEKLRQKLHKKVDLLRSEEIVNNIDLLNEIMKEGIKIYG